MFLVRQYYTLKPFIPWRARIALRRWNARRMRALCAETWPILHEAERVPEGWPGWPDGKRFAFVLTHDVESEKGLNRCRRLMELDVRLGFRSSFNFIPEGEYRVPRELRELISNSGFEVGVHDLRHDGRLYRSRDNFRVSAQRIAAHAREWNASGFRAGFMHHNLDWFHDLDLLYDASTFDTDPFEPQPDGVDTIFPFWVSGPGGRGYAELPYTLIQDFNLFIILRERNIETWKNKLDWIASKGGMALLIVHPDYIDFGGESPAKDEFPVALYKEFLSYVRERYAGSYWQALPREVAAFVHANKTACRNPNLSIGNGALARVPGLRNRHPRTAPRALSPATSPSPGGLEPKPVAQPPRQAPLAAAARKPHPHSSLKGKRAAVLLFSYYPADPRPRRAAEALAGEGMDVDLICLRGKPDEPVRETYHGVNILRVPFKRRRGGKLAYIYQYSAFILSCFFLLTFRSLKWRYDLVHVHNMPDVLVFSALVPKMLGAKVVLDLHDPMPELLMTIFNLRPNSLGVRLLQRFEKASIRFADLVFTVNLACERLFNSRSASNGKVRVIMNSPDETIFGFRPPPSAQPALASKPRRFSIMYHGSLVERHGLDIAVEALEKVRRTVPLAELNIYGHSTAFVEKVMETVKARGLEKAVHYLGEKGLEQIVEAIDGCDLGIVPNRRSTFTEINTPTRIFEYLSRGKPVIAPSATGILDYYSESDLLFFELGNAQDLERQMEYVYSHPSEVEDIVRRGQDVYLAHRWSNERLALLDYMAAVVAVPGRQLNPDLNSTTRS